MNELFLICFKGIKIKKIKTKKLTK